MIPSVRVDRLNAIDREDLPCVTPAPPSPSTAGAWSQTSVRTTPDAFAVLASVPVPFQLFSATEDTYAVAPMVQLDTEGRVAVFRFSNQLACPLDVPPERVESFYAAYRRLGAMIDSPRYRVVFKASDGDLLTLHGHRVLHGRLPFDPTSGARHLQDVYMEWDDLMARRRVLRGEHVPLPATPADAS